LEDFRFYRSYESSGNAAGKGFAFRVAIETTDLFIRADRELTDAALKAAQAARSAVAEHIRQRPEFAETLVPLDDPTEPQPAVVAAMYRAARAAGVGPMAAVAGAVAEAVGRELRKSARWVMVENGGDIYIDADRPVTVGLYAGASPFSGKLGLKLDADGLPWGICTSSATVGPSLSFGCADAATVLCRDAALADAVASGLGNRIQRPEDIEAALDWTLSISGVTGALAVVGNRLGCRGDLTLEKLT
jgi:ApbE superfamily uncharacterized protein (UPF0280 family)